MLWTNLQLGIFTSRGGCCILIVSPTVAPVPPCPCRRARTAPTRCGPPAGKEASTTPWSSPAPPLLPLHFSRIEPTLASLCCPPRCRHRRHRFAATGAFRDTATLPSPSPRPPLPSRTRNRAGNARIVPSILASVRRSLPSSSPLSGRHRPPSAPPSAPTRLR